MTMICKNITKEKQSCKNMINAFNVSVKNLLPEEKKHLLRSTDLQSPKILIQHIKVVLSLSIVFQSATRIY